MAYNDIQSAKKLRAEREHYESMKAQAQCATNDSAIGMSVNTDREGPPSMREEAEKNVDYHRTEADRADRAAAFFREHPEFDEFVALIRAGVVRV